MGVRRRSNERVLLLSQPSSASCAGLSLTSTHTGPIPGERLQKSGLGPVAREGGERGALVLGLLPEGALCLRSSTLSIH